LRALGCLLFSVLVISRIARAEVTPPPDKDAPTISVYPERSKVQLGEPVKIMIAVLHKPDMKVNLAAALELGPAWTEAGDRGEVSETEPDGLQKTIFALTVAPLDLGAQTFPAVPVTYVVGGASRTLMTTPVSIEVTSVVGNGREDLRPIAQPVRVLEQDYQLAWIAGGVLLGGGLFAAVWIARRRRPAAVARRAAASGVVRVLPADEAALERLRALAASGKLDADDRRPVYFELTEIVREYLGRRFGFDALELTSREVVEALGKRAPAEVVVEVGKWLDVCDLIKYARVPASREETEAALAQAVTLVERTRPVAVPVAPVGPAAGAAPPAEPAP
jgi:hypothetical protein